VLDFPTSQNDAVPILKREPDAYPDSIFEIEQPWWVAHLRSRQEKAFARYLQQYEIPYYLPQMEKKVRRGGRTITSYLPLFGGYVFFKGKPGDTDRAIRSHLIANLLKAEDQNELNRELKQLHELQLTDRKLVPYPYVACGDSVTITEGVFKGFHGVVVRERGTERLVVSVSLIRQSAAVEIDREFLRPRGVPGAITFAD
jgi:transcription antitermination factor NusG